MYVVHARIFPLPRFIPPPNSLTYKERIGRVNELISDLRYEKLELLNILVNI